MGLIKGIHHVSMKCCNTAEYEKTIKFYKDVFGVSPASKSFMVSEDFSS